MAWFDGTFGTTAEELKAKYPIAITEDLRTTEDKSRIAIINRFSESDPLYALSDPRMEIQTNGRLLTLSDLVGKASSGNSIVFYHVFMNDDALKAQEAISRFVSEGHGTAAGEIELYRQEPEQLFEYSFGEICLDLIKDQTALTELLPEELKDKRTFILPLTVYKFPCPVCGRRTLQWRGMFEICDECGWEDDGTDNEDEETLPNGDYTIRTYREEYLKLKKEDPDYHWWKQFED